MLFKYSVISRYLLRKANRNLEAIIALAIQLITIGLATLPGTYMLAMAINICAFIILYRYDQRKLRTR